MRSSTIRERYGNLSSRDYDAVVQLHQALLDVQKDGIPVNAQVIGECKKIAEGAGRKKEVLTLQSLGTKTKNGRIYPKYDMFKTSGRSCIYQEFPNIPSTLPVQVFDIPRDSIPVEMSKENPMKGIRKVVRLIKDGAYTLGPMVGTHIYLCPSFCQNSQKTS